MDCPEDRWIDVITPGFDYRPENLKVVGSGEWSLTAKRCRVPSYEKYVHWNVAMGRWHLRFGFKDRKTMSLGSYSTVAEAVTQREVWQSRLQGVTDVSVARKIKQEYQESHARV
jgi:hypothetical protein